MQGRIGLAVCCHLLPESSAACLQCGLRDVTPLPLEPRCNRPWPDWAGLLAPLQSALKSCDGVVVVGAGCLPVGPPPSGALGVDVIRSSTCFALLADEAAVDNWVSHRCYLVTPGWLRQWRNAVAEWGYDTATARAHFGEFARTALLLDTGVDPDAPAHLHDFAQFLGLAADVHPVSLEVLGDRIRRAVQCRP